MTDHTGISPNGAGSLTATEADVYDITIIGAGPTGLFAAFYAGLRGARTLILDSLEEPGGALTAIYPEKYIYDVIGFPKILAKDFVEQCVIQAMQADPTIRLNEQVRELERRADGLIRLGTNRGQHLSRTVIVSAGVGAFEPKRLELPGVRELEGRGVHYFAKRVEDFRDKDVVIVGGGDSAVDWAVTLEPVARHVTLIHRSKFRAHEATVEQLMHSTVDVRFPGCEVSAVETGADGRLVAVSFKDATRDRAHRPRPGTDRRHRLRRRPRSAQDVGLRAATQPDRRQPDHDGDQRPRRLRRRRRDLLPGQVQADRHRRRRGGHRRQPRRHSLRPEGPPRRRPLDQHHGEAGKGRRRRRGGVTRPLASYSICDVSGLENNLP